MKGRLRTGEAALRASSIHIHRRYFTKSMSR
jgi:hypothetical protein